MKKKPKFAKRYVLGEGYPWPMEDNYPGLHPYRIAPGKNYRKVLRFPRMLMDTQTIPKYRLVLERIK